MDPLTRIITSGAAGTSSGPVNVGPVRIYLIGGGGAGASNYGAAGGGGAGGYIEFNQVNSDESFTYTIGAGGTQGSGNPGQSGGNTSITFRGVTYTAGGGAGGGPFDGSQSIGGAGGVLGAGFTAGSNGGKGGDGANQNSSSQNGGSSAYGGGGGEGATNGPSGGGNGATNANAKYGGGGGDAAGTVNPGSGGSEGYAGGANNANGGGPVGGLSGGGGIYGGGGGGSFGGGGGGHASGGAAGCVGIFTKWGTGQQQSFLRHPTTYNQSLSGTFSFALAVPSGQPIVNISPAYNGLTTWNLATDGPITLNSANTWTITPINAFLATVDVWGAGGGEGWNETDNVTRQGGGGGYSTGAINFLAGTQYIGVVGAGGRGGPAYNTDSSASTSYLGGASGGRRVSDLLWGGSGGGASGLFVSSVTANNALMIAGGGGGGSASYASRGSLGGAGGGQSGLRGDAPYSILLDAESNLNDSSGNGLTTTVVGSVSRNTSIVRFGTGSIFVGGSNSRLQLPSSSLLQLGTGDFTISCWVRVESGVSHTYQRAWWFEVNNAGDSALAPELYASDSTKMTLNTPAGQIVSSRTPARSTWTHIAVTRRSGTTYFFQDGFLQGTRTADYELTMTRPPIVGNAYNAGNILTDSWNGYIDDFFVIKGAALYISDFTVPIVAATASTLAKSGKPGTQSAGGAAGSSADSDTFPLAGSSLSGGTGGSSSNLYTGGGGGGGGYYGGGGGGVNTGDYGGGGGGGSGYVHPSLVIGGSTTAGSANTPGGSAVLGRGNAGNGGQRGGIHSVTGGPAGSGQPGLIKISY